MPQSWAAAATAAAFAAAGNLDLLCCIPGWERGALPVCVKVPRSGTQTCKNDKGQRRT